MSKNSKKSSGKYSTKDLYQDDYDRRDDGGAKRKGYLDTSKYPDIEYYKIKEGKNKIDIIPYIIATNNHPQERKKGSVDYKLDIWVHRYIGEQEADVLCLRQTFNKPCPICEEIKRMIASDEYSYKDEEIKKIQPKHREIYNVIDVLKGDEKILLFEHNHFEFQKEIIEEAEGGENGSFITFAEPEDGKTIAFRASEREGKDFKNSFKPKSFKFEDRDPYDDSIVEDAIPLDELLIIPTYDEVKAILFGSLEDEDDEDGEEKPSRRKSKPVKDEEDDFDGNDSEDEEEEEKPTRRKSKSAKDNEDNDEEEEEKPRSKKKGASKEEEDDEEAEEEDDDDKPKKGKSSSGKKKCPHGGEWGKDCDEMKECNDCDHWDECSDAVGD